MRSFLKIAIAAVCVAVSYQQSCSITNNKDINTPDLGAISGQPQANCCKLCQQKPGCRGFAWNNYQGGTCWLKAGTSPLITKPGVNIGILNSAATGSCSITNNKDIALPDLASRSGQAQGNCCSICQSTPGCKGFAYNNYQGGTCWLKAGTGPLIDKYGVSVGVLGGASTECSTSSNQDINLPNLAVRSGQPLSSCCDICRRTVGCRGYAYNDYQGGTCWLKGGTGPIIAKGGVSIGILIGDNVVDNGNGNALITYDQFANAVVNSNGYPRPTQEQYSTFIQGLPKGLITTKEEAAMALTHFLHESDGLRAKREYRCKDNGCPGEYRVPGCDAPGQNYYGRGYIQITWCYNYKAASQDLYNDDRLVNDPDKVAREESVAWETAFWFWKINVHSRSGVSDGAFGVTTKAINGALECDNYAGQPVARHRYEMYKKIRSAFGLSGPGTERGCYN